jgi:hypothetical protein
MHAYVARGVYFQQATWHMTSRSDLQNHKYQLNNTKLVSFGDIMDMFGNTNKIFMTIILVYKLVL